MNSTSESSAIGSELRSDAQHITSAAGDRLQSELDSRKGSAADQAKSVSSAIGRTADQLDDGAPEWLRTSLHKGAEQIQRFADTLEKKDSREILSDVSNFARDNPTTFLGACAAAGFAAARLFKAGASDSSTMTAAQNQGPPPQVNEPMFRAPQAETTHQSGGGEPA